MYKMGSHWYISPWLVNIICHCVYGNDICVYDTTQMSATCLAADLDGQLFVTRVTLRVPLVEQELLPHPKHLRSPPIFSVVCVTRSLVFSVLFCRSLFVLLSLLKDDPHFPSSLKACPSLSVLSLGLPPPLSSPLTMICSPPTFHLLRLHPLHFQVLSERLSFTLPPTRTPLL